MENLRKYGSAPFSCVVIHGGPGACGEMAPVARNLSVNRGVLEPFQSAISLEGQIEEHKNILDSQADLPVTLIGHSWGAQLSFIYAARYPEQVKKVILVASGSFEDRYAQGIMDLRLARLGEKERVKAESLFKGRDDPGLSNGDRKALMDRFARLIAKADSYDPVGYVDENTEFRYEVYKGVWKDAFELRKSGGLLALGEKIQCPVVAFHGDYDPHLYQGVKEPLSRVLTDFRFVLLENCGHDPWMERSAMDKFYEMLEEELKD